jgi:hypothetical protein
MLYKYIIDLFTYMNIIIKDICDIQTDSKPLEDIEMNENHEKVEILII